MQGSFALQVQYLPRVLDQVLIVGYLAGLQAGDGYFVPKDIARLFDSLRLPPPGNIHDSLGTLRKQRLVVRHGSPGKWALTPLGREHVSQIGVALDLPMLEAQLAGSPGVLFAHARHSVIPPEFAPPRWLPGIRRLLERYPFENNVFCMTRFPGASVEGLSDPLADVIEVLRTSLRNHGLVLHLASDRHIDDELFGNVGAYMWACQYGIGLLENRTNEGINYNVVIELGAMLITGRRCAILKDTTTPALPTDLAGQIYKSVDFSDLAAIARHAHLWAAEDLGLGRCADCPVDGTG
ncbi:MAG: hypothetical protein QJR03_06125 [Sphaerobacter sp.]|nr:hypothetical protein [Sphaerobacter sp.]